jgi:hypothetical protein
MAGLKHPVTPDGRYFVVRGKLWRMSDPNIEPASRSRLVSDLMEARRAVKAAKNAGDLEAEAAAHREVDTAKRSLGERGAVWWEDGAPDLNRHAAKTSPYAAWYAGLRKHGRELRGRLSRGLHRLESAMEERQHHDLVSS